MAELKTMYPGVANSPETYLKENVAPEGTTIYVNDASVLGDLPTLAVIGTDQNAETVLVKSKRTDGGLEVQRGIEGLAKKWEKATVVARNFTNYDYKILKENIELLNNDKVSKVSGKSLSTNDYTNSDKAKVDAIPSSPQYTDTIYDDTALKNIINGKVDKSQITEDIFNPPENAIYSTKAMDRIIKAIGSSKANKESIPTSLSQLSSDSTHRTVTDTEKSKWNGKQDKITKEDIKALGFTEHVVLTETAYNALSSTQKNATDIFYYIKA